MQALISLTVAGDRMSSKVKEAIEEMIEESYLLGLSQHEVRQDFKIAALGRISYYPQQSLVFWR